MADSRVTIKPATGTWVVRAGGAVIAESSNALELEEGNLPVVVYFPRDDIAMAFLDATDQKSISPYLGEANYFSVALKSFDVENAAWSYENPIDDVKDIAGYIAFYTDKVAVEHF